MAGGVVVPRRNGGIEGLVGVIQPGGTLVIKVGQGPCLEVFLMTGLGDDPLRVAGYHLGDPFHPP
jgi:hypothetical protein